MSYPGDPYWMTCRYPGTCARCGAAIAKRERAFRYKSGALYCSKESCGQACEREFEAAAHDEAMLSGAIR